MNANDPVAWAVMQPDSYAVFPLHIQAVIHQERFAGGEIVPLYRSPQPTLTAEEREAIEAAIATEHERGAWQWADTLRNLLTRLA